METTRRNFFKIVAAVGAASVVPLRLLAEDAPLAENDRLVAMIRETFQFDISSPFTIVRHEIRTSTIQLGVDAWLAQSGDQWYSQPDLDAARLAAVDVLRVELEQRNISVNDLVALDPVSTFTPTWTGFSG